MYLELKQLRISDSTKSEHCTKNEEDNQKFIQ